MIRPLPSRRRSAARALCALFLVISVFLPLLPVMAAARIQRKAHKPEERKPASRVPAPAQRQPSVPPRITLTESGARGDVFRSGEVFVRATANSHMIVPIGMSRGSVVLAEFPAADPLYSFHEGNAKLAYVNCGQERDGAGGEGGARKCMTRPTDALVLQPGLDFSPPVKGREAEATAFISVQRVSGMVVTFMIYPVLTGAESATRVVVSYDVREVMAARQKAGLMTQLVPAEALAEGGVPANSPLLNAAGAPPKPRPATAAQFTGTLLQQAGDGETQVAPPSPDDLLRERVVAELQRVAKATPAPQFSKPVHGLSVSVLSNNPPVSDLAIQVIAVRNTLAIPLRLLPDQPDLRIMQAARKGEAILDQGVAVRHVATSVGDDNVLLPNEVYFFAVAYEPPALGVRQSLYVSFAHMLASDEPAVVPLTTLLASR